MSKCFRTLRQAGQAAAALGLVAMFGAAHPARADSFTWNAGSGNWSTPSNWNPATGLGGPASSDFVNFTNANAASDPTIVNNVVDAGFAGTVADLTYSSISQSPYLYNVTQIPAGQTLHVANWFALGLQNQPGNAVTNYITYGVINGAGTFMFSGTNFVVENYASASSAYLTTAYLDLTGLTNFVFNSTNATLGIGDTTLPQTSGSFNVRASGNLLLAAVSNSISAGTINVGTCSAPQGGLVSTLVLGAGTNIVNVGTWNVANQKNPANVSFGSATGGLRVRGATGGNSRATILLGNRNVGNGTGTTPGQMLLAGHPVDILADTLTVGEVSTTSGPSGSGNGGEFGTGNLLFDMGVIDATSVVMGNNVAANAKGGRSGVVSSLTVGADATLHIGTGGLTLINQTQSNAVSSILVISNGTVVCNGNITAVTNAAAGTGAASETNIIQFIGGATLTLGAGNYAGTTNSPIGEVDLDSNSHVQLVAPPNGQPAIAVDTLGWPSDDSALTFVISNLPSTATIGTTIPLVNFTTMTGGAFTAPVVVPPAGVTGTLALNGNEIDFTITSSIYPYFTPLSFTPATLCTNTALIFSGASTISTITNVQVVAQMTPFGQSDVITVTNTLGSPGLSVSGLGTASVNATYTLTTNMVYSSVVVTMADANGVSIIQSVGRFDTLTPALVIEAADFNYSSGQFMDTPPNGGLALYVNQVGTPGVDENKATRAATSSYYRPADAVIIQTATPQLGNPPSLTEQKFLDAAAAGDLNDTEQEVGYNTPGDWLNYTRAFGTGGSAPAGTYNVWCYLATSGSGIQTSFSQLTSDPTQGDQTTNFLGYFGSASFSDSGYNNYVYVPLLDQFGNRVALTLTNGQQTFKATVVGNPNIAYYILMPVAPIPNPQVLNVYPDGGAPFESTNELTFVVGPAQGAAIATNDIHLVLNGMDVSTGLHFSQQSGIWTVTYSIASNQVYSAAISVTNLDGLSTGYSFNFDTFDANNFQWEAVDYDFSTNNAEGTGTGGSIGDGWTGGLFIDDPVPSGDTNLVPNNGSIQVNSYWYWPTAWTIGNDGYGAIAHQGVDINWPTNSTQGLSEANAAYRYPDLVGSQVASDYLRFKFRAAQTNLYDPAICQYNIGYFYAGNWLNYTRTFPTNAFNVWARLAAGGGAFKDATLSMVTSGAGTSNQTTQVLGTFSDSNPAGWQVYHTVPLLDTNGNLVVVQLGGKETLRFSAPTNATPSGGALNALYFMLTPAVLPLNFEISATMVGSQINISIPTQIGHNYTLLYTTDLVNPSWTPVGSAIPGDGSVHVVTPPSADNQGYYRVVAQ